MVVCVIFLIIMSEKRTHPGDTDRNESNVKRIRSEENAPKVSNTAGSRRMFGALLGHLGKAEKNLKADSDTIKMQITRRREVSQKNTEESNRVAKLQRTLSVEQKDKVTVICSLTLNLHLLIPNILHLLNEGTQTSRQDVTEEVKDQAERCN